MSDEEFNALLNGPLSHPLSMFMIKRLAMALRFVMDAGGEPATEALRTYCKGLQERDEYIDT